MIDKKGKRHASPPPVEHPPHMLAAPTSNAQKKAFAKLQRSAQPAAKNSASKKASAKKTSSSRPAAKKSTAKKVAAEAPSSDAKE